jgi:hypothetical protein
MPLMTGHELVPDDDPSPDHSDPGLDALRAEYERLTARLMEIIKEKAGDHYDTIRQGPRAAERFFDHPNPDLRLVAIEMFVRYWKSDEKFKEACERIACTDRSDLVRSLAIRALGDLFEDTSDPRIGGSLAYIVHDETSSDFVRKIAYLNLDQIRGRSVLERPNERDFQFPEDVDWCLVGIFLTDD